jgi:2-keto-3-deoxy-L-rhamnonate aldolase RhmA
MDTTTPLIGCWLELPSPEIAEIAAHTGFDFAIVDLEHGVIGIETAVRMMMALATSPTVPWVRVPDPSEGWIKRALDAGAATVMVPRVDDLDSARRLAGFATYGPEGRRGVGVAVARAARWGRNALPYLDRWRTTGGLALQIESPQGLEIAREIAALPGVTQLFFGPADFAAALGTGRDDPRVAAAARAVAEAARAAGRDAGTVTFPGHGPAELGALGYTHVLDAGDVPLLVAGLDASLAASRKSLE